MYRRTVILTLILFSCSERSDTNTRTEQMDRPLVIDVQGHRGCRGLLPENSIEGFIKAVQLGVTTLEMDVVISKDGQVVVSHEPWMSAEMCLDPQGQEIDSARALGYSLFQMTYDEIKQFDCGSKFHPRFPDQEKIKTRKPLLAEVIDTVEQFVLANQLPAIKYNIEIKSDPGRDGHYHPSPDEFVKLALQVISEKGTPERTTLQSFDLRSLREIKRQAPEMTLAFLVENEHSVEDNIQSLGFSPDIYSPDYKLIKSNTVEYLKRENIKLIPWTVNEKEEMKRLTAMGVDGIITDYPDRAMDVLSK